MMSKGYWDKSKRRWNNFVIYSRLVLIVSFCSAAAPLLCAEQVINSISIERDPVFVGEDLHPVQHAANRWHIVTKERVISNELLVAEGDVLDIELLEETERNLRDFDFLEKVEVRTTNESEDSVDVEVVTQDQWSLIPSGILESAGGLTRVGGAISEHNLFGRGKYITLKALYESDVGTTYDFGYFDPQLFGSEYNADVSLSTGPLNESVYISLWRPFKSLDSSWSYGSDVFYSDYIDRLFNDGEEFSRIGVNNHGFNLDGTYAWGERYKRRKIKLRYKYKDETFRALGDLTNTPLPEDQTTGTLSIEYTIKKHRYVKETQLDNFSKVEDISIGRTTSVGIGKAGFPIPRGEDWWEYSLGHYQAFQFGPDHYLFADLDFSSQTVQDTILKMDSQYYWQWPDWQTLAVNLEFARGWDLRSNRQFVLGAESGLRGYPARAFNGDRLLLMNIESRQFWAKRLMTVELGTVVFFDIGNAWKRNESVDLSNLNTSAGFGFRFGLGKLPGSKVVRLDFGWPVKKTGEMQVTLGMGQYF
jgi:outer membrane protein assembly factor BamA